MDNAFSLKASNGGFKKGAPPWIIFKKWLFQLYWSLTPIMNLMDLSCYIWRAANTQIKIIKKLRSSWYTKSTFVIFQLSPLSLPLNDRLLLDNGNQSRLKMAWVDPAMMKWMFSDEA